MGWHDILLPSSTTWTQSSALTHTFTNNPSSFNAVPSGYVHSAPYFMNCWAWNQSSNITYVDDLTFRITHNGTLKEFAGHSADIESATDYYSFGSPMPNRTFTPSEARFSFNGKEKDEDAVIGCQDHGMREYDNRIARFIIGKCQKRDVVLSS